MFLTAIEKTNRMVSLNNSCMHAFQAFEGSLLISIRTHKIFWYFCKRCRLNWCSIEIQILKR